MTNVILVVDGEKTIKSNISHLLKKDYNKIILIGVLCADDQKKYQQERTCWHDLFTLQEYFEKEGFTVSIGTEKGSLFNLIGTVHNLEASLVILPKLKFLTLANDEYEDFLEQIQCPILCY